jgi:hypothetical protein
VVRSYGTTSEALFDQSTRMPWDGVDVAVRPQMGYCPHNQVLFGTWHRPYLMLFEVRYLNSTIRWLTRTLMQYSKNYKALRRALRTSFPVQQDLNTRMLLLNFVFHSGIGQRQLQQISRFILPLFPTKRCRSLFQMVLLLPLVTHSTTMISTLLTTLSSMGR